MKVLVFYKDIKYLHIFRIFTQKLSNYETELETRYDDLSSASRVG